MTPAPRAEAAALTEAKKVLNELESHPRRFQPYPAYQPIRKAWLGSIPEHWQVRRLRFAAKVNPIKSEMAKLADDDEVSFVPMEALHENGGMALEQVRPLESVQQGYTYFRDGDIVIAKITPCFENGKGSIATGLANGVGFGTTELHVVRPDGQLDSHFAFYLTLSDPFRKCGAAEMYGAGGQKRVPDSFIKDFRTPLPPLPEQRAIAAFLDRETAKIDGLVAKKRRLIELLHEKRAAIISHAVTKGLDRNAKMRDSRIQWFGEVPRHWEITRLGWITTIVNDINHEMPPAVSNGVPFLSAKDLIDAGTLNFTEDVKKISEEDFQRLSRKVRPRRNDIIYSRIGACLGKARIVETDDRFLVSYSCCVIRLDLRRARPRFYGHLLDGELVLIEARMRTQGIGVPDLGLQEICRFPVPLPPMQEQDAIADYLDHHVSRIRKLAGKIENAINRLSEYRSALISGAVAGKIDVRGEV